MNSALGLTILVALIASVSCYICRYRTCAEAPPCPKISPESCPGRIARNVSACLGCCDYCILFIEPGERCSGFGFDWTQYMDKECSPGHYCDHRITKICLSLSDKIQGVDV